MDSRLTEDKIKPFRLVKYFAYAGLVVIFLVTLILSLLNTHWVKSMQRKKSEDYEEHAVLDSAIHYPVAGQRLKELHRRQRPVRTGNLSIDLPVGLDVLLADDDEDRLGHVTQQLRRVHGQELLSVWTVVRASVLLQGFPGSPDPVDPEEARLAGYSAVDRD